MRSPQERLIHSHQFIVSLNLGVFSFAKVTNLSGEMELETWEEGGYFFSPRFFPKNKTKVDTLILERGVQTNDVAGLVLRVGTPINVAIIMVKHQNGIVKTYSFEYGLITKWEAGELDALNAGIHIRRIEISHTGLFEI